MILAVTGSMAAGKNYVSSLLEKRGFLAFDADKLVHKAIEEAKNISEELQIQINLSNPFNRKSCLLDSYSNIEEIFNNIK